jgi:hypothetical protein
MRSKNLSAMRAPPGTHSLSCEPSSHSDLNSQAFQSPSSGGDALPHARKADDARSTDTAPAAVRREFDVARLPTSHSQYGATHLREPDCHTRRDGAQLQQRGHQKVQPLVGVTHVCIPATAAHGCNHSPNHTCARVMTSGTAKGHARECERYMQLRDVPDAIAMCGTTFSRRSNC